MIGPLVCFNSANHQAVDRSAARKAIMDLIDSRKLQLLGVLQQVEGVMDDEYFLPISMIYDGLKEATEQIWRCIGVDVSDVINTQDEGNNVHPYHLLSTMLSTKDALLPSLEASCDTIEDVGCHCLSLRYLLRN